MGNNYNPIKHIRLKDLAKEINIGYEELKTKSCRAEFAAYFVQVAVNARYLIKSKKHEFIATLYLSFPKLEKRLYNNYK